MSSIRAGLKEDVLSSPEFKQGILTAIETETFSNIRSQVTRLERLIDVGRISALSQRIAESESFSNADRDDLIRSLINLKDDSVISSSSEFREALTRTLQSFHAARQSNEIDTAHKNFQSIISQEIRLAIIMLEHYGYRCLSESGFTDEEKTHAAENMMSYVRTVSDLRFPEVANQYYIAYEVWTKGRTDLSDRLIASTQHWTDHETEVFLSTIVRASEPSNISKDKIKIRPDTLCFCEKFSRVIESYPDVFAKFLSPAE